MPVFNFIFFLKNRGLAIFIFAWISDGYENIIKNE